LTSPYIWIDPFAEIERAEERGRQQVCAAIERENEDVYRALVRRELSELAYVHARQMFRGSGLSKQIEQTATEVLERAIRQANDLTFYNANPALRVYSTQTPDGFALDFTSAEHVVRRS
jgi:hypothetical protein